MALTKIKTTVNRFLLPKFDIVDNKTIIPYYMWPEFFQWCSDTDFKDYAFFTHGINGSFLDRQSLNLYVGILNEKFQDFLNANVWKILKKKQKYKKWSQWCFSFDDRSLKYMIERSTKANLYSDIASLVQTVNNIVGPENWAVMGYISYITVDLKMYDTHYVSMWLFFKDKKIRNFTKFSVKEILDLNTI